MSRLKFMIPLVLVGLFVTGCANQEPPASSEETTKVEIAISAAASLRDALTEMETAFEEAHPGIFITYNFASSGKLVKQIEMGAPGDLFLSASKKGMDFLEDNQLIVKGSRVDFTQNRLVLITQKDRSVNVTSFEEITAAPFDHLAIGNPESVPAGRYAKQTLESTDQWDALQGKLVLGSDVRQVLTYVESGNAELGIVYASDALISSDKVEVLSEANPQWHDPIVYPAAILTQSSQQEEASAFLRFLNSDEGQEILSKYGFNR